jgi:hypothetical protein
VNYGTVLTNWSFFYTLPLPRDNSIFCINVRNYIASMSHRGKDTSMLHINVFSHVATSSKISLNKALGRDYAVDMKGKQFLPPIPDNIISSQSVTENYS